MPEPRWVVRSGFAKGPVRPRPLAVLFWLLLALSGARCGDGFPEFASSSEEARPAAALGGGPWLSEADLEHVIQPVREQLAAGAFPGAAVAVGIAGGDTHMAGMGSVGWTRNASPVDPVLTLYDLASVTKVIAAGTGILLLADEGRLRLDDPVSRFLPEFREGPKSRVTIRHLLTHTSGLPEGATLQVEGRAARLARARAFPIFPPAGARVEYSDVGYILVGEVIEAAAGEPLPAYLERKLFTPLGMRSTRFSPGLDCEACAPTGRLRDQSLYRGRPFDPLAQRLDGVSGHAGLFSTAADLARFAEMIVNGGVVDGIRILSEEAVREFTAPQNVGRGYRLAWEEVCTAPAEAVDPVCPARHAIGHTGWTGTSIHVDLETGAWVVLLTNRTYEPKAPNRLGEVRREVFGRVLQTARGWRGQSDRD